MAVREFLEDWSRVKDGMTGEMTLNSVVVHRLLPDLQKWKGVLLYFC
jgi:hypothetical protein